MTTFAATTTTGSAPDVEEGIYLARFDGVTAKPISGQYSQIEKDEKGKEIPNSLVWSFTLLSDEGEVLFDEGEAIEVDKVTSMNFNIKSKTVPGAIKVLKALMTVAEFAAFEAQESTVDDDDLVGRLVKVSVFTKESGWPGIEDVLRNTKAGKKGKPAAEAE